MASEQRTLVVGVDASPDGNRALEWARAYAGPGDRIVAVHAWSVPAMVGIDTAAVIPEQEFAGLAEQGLSELLDGIGDPRIEGVTPFGHSGRAIVDEADDRDADLVVVGHQGSGKASVVLGSTANHVIHHTTRPVVIVRGERLTAPERVVVGVDDHDLDDDRENESVRAVQWASRVPTARQIDVVHAWFVPRVAAGRLSNVGADFDEADAAAVAVARHVLDAAGLTEAAAGGDEVAAAGDSADGPVVRVRPASGTPEFALIEASLDADLVVVGSRGRGGFRDLLLGSTSLDVACYSHCPVAIIR